MNICILSQLITHHALLATDDELPGCDGRMEEPTEAAGVPCANITYSLGLRPVYFLKFLLKLLLDL